MGSIAPPRKPGCARFCRAVDGGISGTVDGARATDPHTPTSAATTPSPPCSTERTPWGGAEGIFEKPASSCARPRRGHRYRAGGRLERGSAHAFAGRRRVGAVESPRADAAVVRDPANGYTVSPARAGRVIDLVALRAQAVAAISRPVAGDSTVDVQPSAVEPRVPTTAADDAVSHFAAATSGSITASGGGLTMVLDSSLLRGWVSLQPSAAGIGWDVVVDSDAIAAYFESLRQPDRPAGAGRDLRSDRRRRRARRRRDWSDLQPARDGRSAGAADRGPGSR